MLGASSCYPCHQLHIDSEFCPRDDSTHAALCQAQVNPVALYEPIDSDYRAWARTNALRASVAEAA